MAETAVPLDARADTAPRKSSLPRLLLLALLLALIAAAVYVLFFTDFGHRLRGDPHQVGRDFRGLVDRHPVAAPAIFLAAYTMTAVCLLPVWWLQILAGIAYGLYLGVAWSLAGAVLGATCSFLISRTLLEDWVHNSFEARHARLREIDEKLGHNGLLVVMACRLMHFLPFGVSNYLFGLTRITFPDVLLGTLLGNIPAITAYVAGGAGLEPWKSWRFILCLTALNVILLVPIALRYWKPDWFKRIGVE
jgi:uncharacterized membrane protein YdjX (TVP38/TMEM64 family)